MFLFRLLLVLSARVSVVLPAVSVLLVVLLVPFLILLLRVFVATMVVVFPFAVEDLPISPILPMIVVAPITILPRTPLLSWPPLLEKKTQR